MDDQSDDVSDVSPGDEDEVDAIVDVSDEAYHRIIVELRESIDQIDRSLSEAITNGTPALPRPARDATRRHRQAWKQFMALRKQRWG